MSGIFALVAVDEALKSGAMRILVVTDQLATADVRAEIIDTFGAIPIGMRTFQGEMPAVMVKLPSAGNVTLFVSISFQQWKKTPRWSEYWDRIICVSSQATLPADRSKWMEYLADYLSPGGEMVEVWRE